LRCPDRIETACVPGTNKRSCIQRHC
jgi:hypothetical protein